MSARTLRVAADLVVVECYRCHTTFAMTAFLDRQLRDDHDRLFWCPAGHSQVYGGKSEKKLLEEQLEAARSLAARESERRKFAEQVAEAAKQSRAAYRGHVTRLKRRLGAGRCPCCSREFPDLADHLAEEHPGYAGEGRGDG